MLKLDYSYKQKKRSSTLISLALSEFEAAEKLVESSLYREALIHMYFCSFYLSNSLLVKVVSTKPTHKNLEAQLHKAYGKSKVFPRRYIDLHSLLHNMRNEYSYNVSHSPNPKLIIQKFNVLKAYLAYTFKCVPKLETSETLSALLQENPLKIKDFSFDIYCPKTYSHHTRITFWHPPFYLNIFSVNQLQIHARKMLKSLKVNRSNDYVVGINSRLNQYEDTHLLMLDMDTFDSSVEVHLSKIGGVLLRSGRGFHFIGNAIISGQNEWLKTMKKLRYNKELKNYIDQDHIEISIKRGYSTLRVTASNVKPHVPVFFKAL